LVRHTSSSGGRSDSDVIALAVIPIGTPLGSYEVMTVTPPTSPRNSRRHAGTPGPGSSSR
jgi:hypothetical protein